MKRSKDHHYSEISSFEDLRLEKERLKLKSKLIEARINMDILLIRKTFSVSNLILSFSREFVLPEIFDFLGDLSNKVENEENCGNNT